MQLADRGKKERIPEEKSERAPSFAADSRDQRSPSEIELSHPSKHPPSSSSLRASEVNTTTTRDARTPSMSTNAEYIATNKRRVRTLFMLTINFAFIS